jgi:hypothetical protein
MGYECSTQGRNKEMDIGISWGYAKEKELLGVNWMFKKNLGEWLA